MSERVPAQRGELQSQADRTLLGVPAPRVETSSDAPLRSPVFVRSGTSVADVEPPPVPRMALPSRPPRASAPEGELGREPPPVSVEKVSGVAWFVAALKLPARVAGTELALWMVLTPVLLAAAAIIALAGALLASGTKREPRVATTSPAPTLDTAPLGAAPTSAKPLSAGLSELEGKPQASMTAGELLRLAEGRSERQREAAQALRRKVEASPALAKDKAVQGDLLRLVADAETARDALAAMAALEPPIGTDLLYEVWTGTASRTDTTELSRALLYSTDLRPKASAALGVALDLRIADSCERYQAILPRALKDGDRRALHLLIKLTAKRGCGPKKNEDCYACLRDQADELTATINAVKSRRAPSYTTP